jgi:acyl-CoA synthetase (AMP-forming)/AMP-acid ligase II
MVIGSLSTITSGTTCVFPSPSFDPEQSFKSIFKEKCTSIYGTPTMFVDLLNHQDLGKYDLSSVNTG